MGVFVSRESEAIIPNIFFFLVLLSYERYHSKQIIGIPKIIQLCDGIMASGRKAVTHGNGTHLPLCLQCHDVPDSVSPLLPTSNCAMWTLACTACASCGCVWVCVDVCMRAPISDV
jgi:hypothetical protein